MLSGGTAAISRTTDARGMVEAFGPTGPFLHSALAAFGPQAVVDFFEAEGVPTKIEPAEKSFRKATAPPTSATRWSAA